MPFDIHFERHADWLLSFVDLLVFEQKAHSLTQHRLQTYRHLHVSLSHDPLATDTISSPSPASFPMGQSEHQREKDYFIRHQIPSH